MQAKVLLEVLEGLRYAHELKDYDGRSLEIVHRDVTPHNIFITYDGQVKLLDFGIAKAATSSVRTATGVIKGKLTYMAPEQARGEHVDARADLYAVGVMLWEAVTGRRRWPTGLSQPALFTRLASGEAPESPNAASLGYPAEIDAIVLKAMATKPDDRFQTAAEFRDALEAAVRGLAPVSLRELGAMLAEAFIEGRQRLRNVIEEQFRAIDSGNEAPPHQLPAVSPPGAHTGSDVMDLPIPVEPVAEGDESRSRRMTVSAGRRSPPPWWQGRSRVALIAAGALMVAAVAIAVSGYRMRAAAGPSEAPSASATPEAEARAHVAPNAAQSLPSTDLGGSDVRSRAEGQAPAAGDLGDRPEPTTRRGGRAGGVTAPASTRAGAAHAAAPEAPAAAAPAAPAPSEAAPADPVIRRPEGKPKVQLERDNPWP